LRTTAKLVFICLICAILALSFTNVLATSTVSLSWYKNNGYGMGNDVGGQWTITADASPDVTSVGFYLDSNLQQNDTAAPFTWAFNTADYSLGTHTIKVVAYNFEGQTVSTQVERNFVEYSMNVFWVIIGGVVAMFAVLFIFAVYRVMKGDAKRSQS
jgi:hypothetical protein